jgi:hypothetical protein
MLHPGNLECMTYPTVKQTQQRVSLHRCGLPPFGVAWALELKVDVPKVTVGFY